MIPTRVHWTPVAGRGGSPRPLRRRACSLSLACPPSLPSHALGGTILLALDDAYSHIHHQGEPASRPPGTPRIMPAILPRRSRYAMPIDRELPSTTPPPPPPALCPFHVIIIRPSSEPQRSSSIKRILHIGSHLCHARTWIGTRVFGESIDEYGVFREIRVTFGRGGGGVYRCTFNL